MCIFILRKIKKSEMELEFIKKMLDNLNVFKTRKDVFGDDEVK
jgi:hypothetical protein